MKISIYILSIAIILSLGLFIFWETGTIISGRHERYYFLLHAYFILPAIFVVNIIRTIFTYIHFKELTVFRPLPYVLNGITLYLLLNYAGGDDTTGIVVAISMSINIVVEFFIMHEIWRGRQCGRVL